MKKSRFLLLLFAAAVLTANIYSQAQTEAERVRDERERQRAQRIFDARLKQLRTLEENAEKRPPVDWRAASEARRERREWEQRLKEVRAVDPADKEKYKEFLSRKNTGIFKLLRNSDCSTKHTVDVSGECAGFVPGSSDFSFRAEDYTFADYHDIGYNRGEILTDGFFSQGILTALGDVPVEQADLSHPGLEFLAAFDPATEAAGARKTARRIAEGTKHNSFRYSTKAMAAANTTYALRVAAYRLGNPAPRYREQKTSADRQFGGLSYDNRKDIIVVFRIVRMDADGNATIVWKELQRKASPKITFAKGEPLADFKP